MNLFNFLNKQKRWSRNTFGDGQRNDGWCYDLSKVVKGKSYIVACCTEQGSRFALSGVSNHGPFGWITSGINAQRVRSTVYAFREIDPLPEPPPLPDGWEDER